MIAKLLDPARLDKTRAAAARLFPGLLAAGTVAAAARFLSEHYGGPAMLFALLLGLAFYFLSVESRCAEGIEFAAKHVLRFGVALLGLRITFEEIAALGLIPILIVIGAVALTLVSGVGIARLFNRGWRYGLLTGGAVAICGASAALAIASVLPRNERTERNTLFTVASVTTLSTLAMVFYPIIVRTLELDDAAAGLLLGGTIHDVAQVIGAGYSISEQAGETATLVKLVRVSMLFPIIVIFSLMFRGRPDVDPHGRLPVPLFLIGFVALVVLGSVTQLPAWLDVATSEISRWCLLMAIAAVGMKTSLKAMTEVGFQHGFIIVAETILLGILVLGAILALG